MRPKTQFQIFQKNLALDFVLFVWNPERWRCCVADLGGGLGTLGDDLCSNPFVNFNSEFSKSTCTRLMHHIFPKTRFQMFKKVLALDFVLFVWNPARWRRSVAGLGGGLGTLNEDSGHDFAPKSRKKHQPKPSCGTVYCGLAVLLHESCDLAPWKCR